MTLLVIIFSSLNKQTHMVITIYLITNSVSKDFEKLLQSKHSCKCQREILGQNLQNYNPHITYVPKKQGTTCFLCINFFVFIIFIYLKAFQNGEIPNNYRTFNIIQLQRQHTLSYLKHLVASTEAVHTAIIYFCYLYFVTENFIRCRRVKGIGYFVMS